jgi:hypothetical protein
LGRIIRKQSFGADGYKDHHYNDKGQELEYLEYKQDKLEKKHVYLYNEKGLNTEVHATHADGSLYYRTVQTYTKDGKYLEHFHYMGAEDKLYERNIREYDERGNQIVFRSYKEDGSIRHQSLSKFNEHNKPVESSSEWFEEIMIPSSTKTYSKYNEHGDCIESITLDYEGKIKYSHTFTHQYDSDGKRIIPARDDDEVKGETEQLENDAHGNWIKKTIFYNKIPTNIIVRQISYHGETPENEPPFVHPLMHAAKEMVEETNDRYEDFKVEDAKWLVDSPNTSPENFSTLRYYALNFKEAPSVITYTGPHIEAMELMRELKENMKAKEIHSHGTVWGGHSELISRYTLLFPGYHYLLQATGINTHDADEFQIPGNLDIEKYGNVYLSQIQLLRPSEYSGKRDEYFEQELEEYIQLCSLDKKPDKPVINMIEVKGNSFAMVEHSLNDDFEIKDLDINYGQGFAKFHEDLMHRFNTSSKGLVLFHGQPGTGKTYYIRHLLRKMVSNKKVVIYMPPNMVDHLVEPSFMTFLSSEIQEWSNDGFFCVLLIEDAEPLLAKRVEGVRIQGVTNLLNMTDGLLNDMLNLQIICTFNVDLRKLDSALLRPGRLIARKEFKALGVLDANLLAQRLGIKYHFKAPATLGEIYALGKNSNTIIHDVEPDKNTSKQIDDLL